MKICSRTNLYSSVGRLQVLVSVYAMICFNSSHRLIIYVGQPEMSLHVFIQYLMRLIPIKTIFHQSLGLSFISLTNTEMASSSDANLLHRSFSIIVGN